MRLTFYVFAASLLLFPIPFLVFLPLYNLHTYELSLLSCSYLIHYYIIILTLSSYI